MKKLILGLAAAAALAGCIKMDKSPPTNLPAYVKMYPGSTNVMNMNMGSVTADAFTTPDAPAQVMTFYRTQAASDALPEAAAPAAAGATAGQQQATFNDAATGRMLVVIAKPQAAGSMVSLTWTTPKAPS
jgi:hypothetical protein